MKKYVLALLLIVTSLPLSAQPVAESEVPAAAVTAFKAAFPTLPPASVPNWYLDKAPGSTKALYKVSFMVPGGFESYIYNLSGAEVYRIKDFYTVANAPQAVVTTMKAAYTASPLQKISEYSSAKYNIKGYVATYGDMKFKYSDGTGVLTTTNPSTAISLKADADATNFTAAVTPGKLQLKSPSGSSPASK